MSPLTLIQRRRRFILSSVSGVILVGGILAFVNALSQWLHLRVDLTHQQAYSLTPASRKLVRGLDERVLIKVFFSENLPQPYSTHERYVRDLLGEYRAASRKQVQVEVMLPNPPQDFEMKAQEAGIVPLQFEEQGSDQLQIRRGYMGLKIQHLDKTEVIPVIRDIGQLEYELTSKIARLVNRKKKVIAYTVGHGEVDWLGHRSRVAQELSPLYEFKPVSLMPGTTAPIEADALLVLGPKQPLEPTALWVIDQSIMRGLPTAFFVDAKNVMANRFAVAPLETGLRDLVRPYGIDVGTQLIYDAQSATIGIQQNIGGFVIPMQVRYPMIPLVTRVSKTSPILRGVQAVGLPFVTSVEPVAKRPAGTEYTALLESSGRSWRLPDHQSTILPDQIPKPTPGEPHGPFVLAGAWEGTFNSYFQDKPIPVPGASAISISPRTSVVVVGTSFLVDPSLPPFQGVDGLMSNLLGYLSKDDTLLGIRSKGELIRPLRPVSHRTRQITKGVAIFLPALLAALFGLWRWRQRRARHAALAISPVGAA